MLDSIASLVAIEHFEVFSRQGQPARTGNHLNHPGKPYGKETEASEVPALSETKADLEAPMVDDLKRLQEENADLYERVAELEQLVTEASKKAQHWAEQLISSSLSAGLMILLGRTPG